MALVLLWRGERLRTLVSRLKPLIYKLKANRSKVQLKQLDAHAAYASPQSNQSHLSSQLFTWLVRYWASLETKTWFDTNKVRVMVEKCVAPRDRRALYHTVLHQRLFEGFVRDIPQKHPSDRKAPTISELHIVRNNIYNNSNHSNNNHNNHSNSSTTSLTSSFRARVEKGVAPVWEGWVMYYIYIYIYTYREREREREGDVVYVFVCWVMYFCGFPAVQHALPTFRHNFTRVSHWGALKRGIATTQPSHIAAWMVSPITIQINQTELNHKTRVYIYIYIYIHMYTYV